jgi:5'(3')-deoxyribonucleotidase
MKRIRIGVDVDEVLAQFQNVVLARANSLFDLELTPESFTTWDIFPYFPEDQREIILKEIGTKGWCSALPVCEGSQEALQELRKLADVYIVTSPFSSETWSGERTGWLKRHFGIKPDEIVSTKAKWLVGGIHALLDDNPHHIQTWGEQWKETPMLWHIPNTRTMQELDHLRVKTWQDVFETVEGMNRKL